MLLPAPPSAYLARQVFSVQTKHLQTLSRVRRDSTLSVDSLHAQYVRLAFNAHTWIRPLLPRVVPARTPSADRPLASSVQPVLLARTRLRHPLHATAVTSVLAAQMPVIRVRRVSLAQTPLSHRCSATKGSTAQRAQWHAHLVALDIGVHQVQP